MGFNLLHLLLESKPYYDWVAGKLQILFKERYKGFPYGQNYILETIQNLYRHEKLHHDYLLGAAVKGDDGFIRLEIGIKPFGKRIGYIVIGKINDGYSTLDTLGYDLDFLRFFDELIPILSQYLPEKTAQPIKTSSSYSVGFLTEFSKGKTPKSLFILISCTSYLKYPNDDGSIGLMRRVYAAIRATWDELNTIKQENPDLSGITYAIETFKKKFPSLTAENIPEEEILKETANTLLTDFKDGLLSESQNKHFFNNRDFIPAAMLTILDQVQALSIEDAGELLAIMPLVEKWKKDLNLSQLEQVEKQERPIAKDKKIKQKRGPQLETEEKLNRLRQLRLECIQNNRPIITRQAAMNQANITDKTVKQYARELWTRWSDRNYR